MYSGFIYPSSHSFSYFGHLLTETLYIIAFYHGLDLLELVNNTNIIIIRLLELTCVNSNDQWFTLIEEILLQTKLGAKCRKITKNQIRTKLTFFLVLVAPNIKKSFLRQIKSTPKNSKSAVRQIKSTPKFLHLR